jgi:ATP synthase F1 delta subunit
MKEIDVERLHELAGDKASELESELHNFVRLLRREFELKAFFEEPTVPPAGKMKLLDDIYPRASGFFRDLVEFLIKEDLVKRIGNLSEAYSKLISRRTGTSFADVVSAHPLSEEELGKIREYVGKGFRLHLEVNPKLIGGYRIICEDGMYVDISLAGFLSELKEAILV